MNIQEIQGVKGCMLFILEGMKNADKDCVRDYAEQLQDLIISFLDRD